MTTPPTPKTLPAARTAFNAWVKTVPSKFLDAETSTEDAMWLAYEKGLAAQPPAVAALNCRQAGPGKGLCDYCAAGQYVRCRYCRPLDSDDKGPGAVPAIPEGWKLVPIDATVEMVTAAIATGSHNSKAGYWSAMLAAAPQPPAGQQPVYSKSEVKRLATHMGWEPKGGQHLRGEADNAIWAIIYDDQDRRHEIVQGERGARHRFEQISSNWNAHLFVKIASNSRDDRHANDNARLVPATAGEAPDAAYNYAAELATSLFKKHFAGDDDYVSGRVVWGLCDTTVGVLTQIDNMVSGLSCAAATAGEATAAQGAPGWMEKAADEVQTTLAVQGLAAPCATCDGTGDVHGYDGEWLGPCPWCRSAAPGNGEAGK